MAAVPWALSSCSSVRPPNSAILGLVFPASCPALAMCGRLSVGKGCLGVLRGWLVLPWSGY